MRHQKPTYQIDVTWDGLVGSNEKCQIWNDGPMTKCLLIVVLLKEFLTFGHLFLITQSLWSSINTRHTVTHRDSSQFLYSSELAKMAMEMAIRASAAQKPPQFLPTRTRSSTPRASFKPQLGPNSVSLPTSITISLLAIFTPPNEAKALSKDQIVSSLNEVSTCNYKFTTGSCLVWCSGRKISKIVFLKYLFGSWEQ